jgi:hypothetical protein
VLLTSATGTYLLEPRALHLACFVSFRPKSISAVR